MTNLEQSIMNKVRDYLGEERLQKVIIYLDPNPKRSEDPVAVGDIVVTVPWDSHLVFIDFEPMVNWGHACSYLAIRANGNDAIEFKAHMPPFLKTEKSQFELLWRGPLAPEWAVATDAN